MKIKIKRTYLVNVTLGNAVLLDDTNNELMGFSTLELPDKDNKKRISCIPEGTYQVTGRISEKFGHHLLVNDVYNRDLILIHSGNYTSQTNGCILVGSGHTDINRDGIMDVVNSKATLERLLKLAKTPLTLEISSKR